MSPLAAHQNEERIIMEKSEKVVTGKALRLARAFSSPDETRPALRGIHVTEKYVEACDGHMGVRIPCENPGPGLLIPPDPVKVAEKYKGNVTVRLNGDALLVAGESETLFAPMDPIYPDMGKIWPAYETGTSFYVNPRKVADAFKAIADYLEIKRFQVWRNGVKVTVNDPIKAILIEGEGFQAIMMPVRGPDKK
jgi:hypothetical protein